MVTFGGERQPNRLNGNRNGNNTRPEGGGPSKRAPWPPITVRFPSQAFFQPLAIVPARDHAHGGAATPTLRVKLASAGVTVAGITLLIDKDLLEWDD